MNRVLWNARGLARTVGLLAALRYICRCWFCPSVDEALRLMNGVM